MLNSITKGEMKTISLPIFKNQYVLCTNTELGKCVQTIITYLDDDEEKQIKEEEVNELLIVRGKRKYKIARHNIIGFGELDLSKHSQDSKVIKEFNFLNYLKGVGIPIPAKYDYDTHTCKSSIDTYQIEETWCPLELIRFGYATINKPSKVLIFKHGRPL